jgi:hypothetical protein
VCFFYSATIDSSVLSFEGEEGFEEFEEDPGQLAIQGKPSFDLLLFILLVVLIVPLYIWLLVSCVMFGPPYYAYLFPSM